MRLSKIQKKIIILFLLIYSGIDVNSQNTQKPDSLKTLIQTTHEQRRVADIYYEIAMEMINSFPDSTLKYAEKSYLLAATLNYEKGEAYSYLAKGSAYSLQGNFNKAVNFLVKAICIFNQTGDSVGISKTNLRLGYTYYCLNEFDKSQNYNRQALRYLKPKDNGNRQDIYNNMGLVYSAVNMRDSALFYFNKSIKVSKLNGGRKNILYELGNIGNLYLDFEENFKAKDIFLKVTKLAKETENQKVLVISYLNLSLVFQKIADIDKMSKNKSRLYSDAWNYADSALHLSDKLNLLLYKSYAFKQISSVFSRKQDYKHAYSFLEDYINLKDSLFQIEKITEIKKIENQYKSEQQKLELERVKNEEKLNNKIIKSQKQIIVFGIIALGLILFLLFFVINLYRKKNKVNSKLNEQNIAVSDQKIEIQTQRNKMSELAFELKKTNRMQNKFISILAHDLKNPFQAILGFSDMLKAQTKNGQFENAEKYADYILETATNTHVLLENLLFWSQSQSGLIQYRPENIKVLELISESIKIVKNNAASKKIKLEISSDKKTEIFADKIMISTVIRNLVSNAVKFTEHEGTVLIYSEIKSRTIEIIVTDTGIGIKPDKISKIFKADINLSDYGTDNEKGSGLGLSVCKEFVKKNKGSISVKSTPGKGSTFVVSLPQARPI